MRFLYRLVAAWRALFHSGRIDTDLAEEMRFHVERETEANVARGMTRDAARRAARLTFGSVDTAHERARDERPGVGIRQIVQDMRFGARILSKSPVFAFTAVAIIALGVAATTAIFSVVYGVMLRPLPFREPDRLVSIWLARGQGRSYPNAADAAELQQLRGVFTGVALVRSSNANLSLVGDAEPRRLQAARVSANLFDLLGVSAELGRTFARGEDEAGHERVVVLSDALWRSQFGADASAIGRQIRLNGALHTVIGVMPSEFQYPTTGLDAWVPAVLEPGELQRTAINNYRVVARLDPRATVAQARREATALAKRLGSMYRWNAGAGFTVDSMLDDAVSAVRPALALLLGAVSFLLLIACVNLSNLFGARATARAAEFAVRLALGASRPRLIAQAVAESAPLLAVGGILGVLAAQWMVRAFVASAPTGLPRLESIALSAPVVAYSVVVLILAGVAASIAPAVQAWRSDFTSATKTLTRSSTTGRAQSIVRRIGVAAQVAFALPLLIGASLLMESALAVSRVTIGFRPEQVATLAFEVSLTKYPSERDVGDYYARLLDAVHAAPGVASAAITNRIPLAGAQTNPVHFERTSDPADEVTDVDSRTVTAEYFVTLGIPLVAGRTFTGHDDASSPVVGIVDDRLARALWPGQSALGKRFRGPTDRWGTIVGVVGHVRTSGVEVDPRPQVYWSARQWSQMRAVLAVRSTLEPSALFPGVVSAIRSVDPEQSVFELRTMQDVVDSSLAQRRLTTMLMIGFGGIALLLAAVGIYGVVAYGVSQRVREFGIRIAIGASGRQITGLVVWQGASMGVVGSVIGLIVALAAAGVMRNLVFGVAPRDVASFGGATVLLMLAIVVASYVPARRAARVDPAVALRSE